ncbi:MAG: acylneuraminate cytidylyltransferase family protein [Patescibacteria group bacterium]
MATRTVAIIPARGGSKSIPKKNIVPLCGVPLVGHVIRALKGASSVERIIVSTDDAEIAQVAASLGVEVPFMRPTELSTDATPGVDPIVHAVEWMRDHENDMPEYVVVVQPTSPFVTSAQIDAVYERMLREQADSGITIVPVPRIFHPFHIRAMDESGILTFVSERDHYAHPTRQSDTPYWAFGNLYWVRSGPLLSERKLEVGKRVGVPIDVISAYDINDPDDLSIASQLCKNR